MEVVSDDPVHKAESLFNSRNVLFNAAWMNEIADGAGTLVAIREFVERNPATPDFCCQCALCRQTRPV